MKIDGKGEIWLYVLEVNSCLKNTWDYLSNTLHQTLFTISAPGEESQAPSQPAPAAPASPPAEANYGQDQQQVNAGEEANKAMEKTKSELNEKV